MCQGWPFQPYVREEASIYESRANAGLYSNRSVLLSGGSIDAGCNELDTCDVKYYKPEIIVAEDAKYTSLHGSCARLLDDLPPPNPLAQPNPLDKLPMWLARPLNRLFLLQDR